MSLIACKECGAKISTKAPACPSCGAKRPRETSRAAKLAALLLAVFGALLIYTKATEPPATPQQIAAKASDAKRGALAYDLAATIKARVRDPDSLKVTWIGVNSSATTACASYRARNGFGGMNSERAVIVDRKPLEPTEGNWNTYCPGLRDYTSAAP
ncbi:MAG: hypothetical protein A3E25_05465 [Burkholderiales bacterium RIFCSPHIGHO2_12_FULL_69_20]|nr:MAG: hypothetical protein A3E25_05465 [Burkholderiales bacterium RIFCSPHIGHO2_12_FULL_69_20]